MANQDKPKLALALGSGAARGYAHLAVIKRLQEEGIEISHVSGASVGALFGAYYCLNGEIDSALELSEKMRKRDWLGLLDLGNIRNSLIKGNKIRKFLYNKFFQDKTFEDPQIPLTVCATNLTKSEPEYFEKGSLTDAVMASVSLPGIFPPYKLRGNLYVDGGVLDPVPVRPLYEKRIKKIVGVNINHTSLRKLRENPRTLPVVLSSFYLMMEKPSGRFSARRVFPIKPEFKIGFIDSMKFYEWKKFYKIGEKEIDEKMPALKRWLRRK